MALDLTALADFTKDHTDELLLRSMFQGKTAALVRKEGTLMTGVKSSERIGILDTDAVFQDGAGCNRTPSGTTTLTQRSVTVGEIAVIEDICVKTLNKKYLSQTLAKGSWDNSIPFEKEYTDLKIDKIEENLEKAIWQGDTTSNDPNLKRFDGYIKVIDTANVAVQANTNTFVTGGQVSAGAGGITETNVRAVVKSMWKALPAKLQGKKDIRFFCGWDVFTLFNAALSDANLYHYVPNGKEVSDEDLGEIIIPGTNYKLTAVHGLDGTSRLFGLRMKNMVEATDLENEEEKWELMPDQYNKTLRFDVEFKFGVQVGFPDEIVSFKLAA